MPNPKSTGKWSEMERGKRCVELLRHSVALIDALGFEAKVYLNEDGKRVADMFKHESGYDLATAFTEAHSLRTEVMQVLQDLGVDGDPGKGKG